MLQARTDLRAVSIPQPLSAESVRSLFDDIREDLGLRRRDGLPSRAERRENQRDALVAAGFPFASDEDYQAI